MKPFVFVVVAALCAAALVARAQQSQSFTTSGGVNSPQRTPISPVTFSLAQFQPGRFERLDRIEWNASGTVFGRGTVRNTSSFGGTRSINVSTTVSIQRVGGSLGNLGVNLFPSGFSSVFVPANGSSSAFAAGTNSASGVLDASQFSPYLGSGSVLFQLSAATGSLFGVSSGGSIEAFGSMSLTYIYTPIGQVASDPIGRTSGTSASPVFDAVPSSRWFQFALATATPAFEVTARSATRFSSVPGAAVAMRVEADGIDLGVLPPSQSLTLPTPARRLVLRPTSPTASLVVPLGFVDASGSFSVLGIPAPATGLLFVGSACAMIRRRR